MNMKRTDAEAFPGRSRFFSAFVLLAVLFGGGREVSAQGFGDPARSASLAADFPGPLPHAENGFIVFRKNEPKPEVLVYGRDGNLVSRADLLLADAKKARVYAMAVNIDGTAAASVNFLKQDGTLARAIVLIEKPGRITRVIRTNPVSALGLCFGADQSIWAFVTNRDAEEEKRDYEVFEKYSLEGRLLGRYVPRSSFKSRKAPALHAGGPAGFTVLRCSSDRIGAYSSAAREWIELDSKGTVLGRWNVSLSAGVKIERLVLTSSGSVYMASREGSQKGPYTQGGLYALDRSSGLWVPLPGTFRDMRETNIGLLYGVDGDQFVFTDTREPGLLMWFDAPK